MRKTELKRMFCAITAAPKNNVPQLTHVMLHRLSSRTTPPYRNVLKTGQITASSNEVTLNSSYFWESTKMDLNSGFGNSVIWPTDGELRHKAGRPGPDILRNAHFRL